MFLSSACEPLDLGRVFLLRAKSVLDQPHDPIYSPLSNMFDTQCSSFDIQRIRIPCIRPTVHLICGHSQATVGLYAGETVCFVPTFSSACKPLEFLEPKISV